MADKFDVLAKFDSPEQRVPLTREEQRVASHKKVQEYTNSPLSFAGDLWRNTKENAVNIAAGPPSALLGGPADLIALGTAAAYSGYNYFARGGDFTMPDFSDIPATADWYGELMGADPDSYAFMASSIINPVDVAQLKNFPKPDQLARIVGGSSRAVLTDVQDTGLKAAKLLQKTNPELHAFEVWKETGWWKDGQGKWRFYIPDNESTVNHNIISDARVKMAKDLAPGESGSQTVRLGSLLNHEKLFEHYPFLKDRAVKLHFHKDANGELKVIGGATRGDLDERGIINMKSALIDPDKTHETLLHEVQHAVQRFEGLSAGANGTEWSRLANDMIKYQEPQKAHDFIIENMDELLDEALDEDAYNGFIDKYMREQGLDPDKMTLEQWGNKHAAIQRQFELFLPVMMDAEDPVAQAGLMVKAMRHDATARQSFDMDMAMQALKAMSDSEVEAVMDEVPLRVLRTLAVSQYWNNKGEVEARIAGELRKRGEEWYKAKGVVPTDAGLELRTPVAPGEEVL